MSEQVKSPILRAVLLLALIAPFWSLGHPLVEVDDARYAEVPREMVAGGDWATPHLNGFDYVEKPPLWYWLCASSYKILGVSEAAARLPLALLAVAGLLGTAWLGGWLYTPGLGAAAGGILGSCGLFFFLAHYITPDMGLTVWLLWCSGMLLRALLRPEDAWWAGPAAWVFAGLAFLSKGLVAVVFPGVWTLGLLALYPKTRGRKTLWGVFSPVGLLLFAAVVAPWFFVMEKRHPGFFHFFFVEQHFQRFLTQKYNRTSPWWFFLAVAPAGLLPWTLFALSGFTRACKNLVSEPRDGGLALWAALVLCFFSASQSKLATYILPIFPHLALLAARGLERPLPGWARNISSGLGLLLLAAGTGALLAAAGHMNVVKLAGGFDASYLLGCLAVLALGEALLISGIGESRTFTNLALAGLLAGGVSLFVLSRRSELVSVKTLCERVAERRKPGDLVWAYDAFEHGVPFYLRRPYDKIIYWVGELGYAKRDQATAARFGDDNDVRRLGAGSQRAFIFLPTSQLERVLALVPPERVRGVTGSGPWTVVELD